MALPAGARHLILYDGLCGLCDATVQRVLSADRRRVFAFAPLQGDTAAAARAAHTIDPKIDSLLVLLDAAQPSARVRVRSAAALAIARELGGWYRFLAPLSLVPRPLRDWGYDFIARHRHRWFGTLATCRLPAPDERDRFLT